MENSNPKVHNVLKKEMYGICNAIKFWVGLGWDFMIEERLMRSVKTSEGLTHGIKMTKV